MRRAALAAAAAVAISCGTVAVGMSFPVPATDPAPGTGTGPGSGTGRAAADRGVAPTSTRNRGEEQPSTVARVDVPRAGVHAPLVPVAADEGLLVPPADPQVLGWWSGGAAPGSPRGAVVVAGHARAGSDYALRGLSLLERGDRARVTWRGEQHRYSVVGVRVLRDTAVPERAGRMFAGTGPARLVLVTCSDWDGVGYRRVVVATAKEI